MPTTTFDVRRGGLTFPVRDHRPYGDPRGVILALHGWPQDGRAWDAVASRLTRQGYRVLAPDLRGAAPGAAPRFRWAYRASELVADVVAIIDAIGEPVHLVGHDWGSSLAWQVAGSHPELVQTLTAVSVPHPGAFVRAAKEGQLFSWWYATAFQVPVVPELLLGNSRFLQSGLRKAGLGERAARRDAERMRDRRVRTGGVNWYRGLFFTTPGLGFPRIKTPVLQVWSDGDPVVKRSGCERSADYCEAGFELAVLEGVGHFIPDEAPDDLAALVLRHVGSLASA